MVPKVSLGWYLSWMYLSSNVTPLLFELSFGSRDNSNSESSTIYGGVFRSSSSTICCFGGLLFRKFLQVVPLSESSRCVIGKMGKYQSISYRMTGKEN